MILARYRQQPGEIKSRSVSFKRYLDRMGDAARAVDPIEVSVPQGLTLVAGTWVGADAFYKALVQGQPGRHKLTVWLNTAGGERLEADLLFIIKDV